MCHQWTFPKTWIQVVCLDLPSLLSAVVLKRHVILLLPSARSKHVNPTPPLSFQFARKPSGEHVEVQLKVRSLPFNSRRLEDYLESCSGGSEQTQLLPAGILHVPGERSKGSVGTTPRIRCDKVRTRESAVGTP
ncbi:hypothetical protein KCU73_g131, partial [Aureobasidium melanogenum]